MRLCLVSGLAAGVGTGVLEAEACLVRGSGLGVRAVSARSRAARAKASGDDGSEDRKQTLQFPVVTERSSSEGSEPRRVLNHDGFFRSWFRLLSRQYLNRSKNE